MNLRRLRGLKGGLATVQSELSLEQLLALIAIAIRPGISVNELAEELSVPQQTASRYVAVLLGRYQTIANTIQHPLINQQISADDPRKRALELNDLGRSRLSKLLDAMNE